MSYDSGTRHVHIAGGTFALCLWLAFQSIALWSIEENLIKLNKTMERIAVALEQPKKCVPWFEEAPVDE
ncbi:MAG: hypothetical protein GTO63_15520 [Anaerolineae bacterium]|nr:hypothetical protein [Anaerolineae bacterium]NIN96238.1 hypothetical protein [Anaerolineae bacterium]NIQ79258.1 hypothetical protein [Anaerolineae bacterium]